MAGEYRFCRASACPVIGRPCRPLALSASLDASTWRRDVLSILAERRWVSLSTLRDLVGLAWPIATAMLGETAMGLVDTKLVGGIGAAALGGVGVATSLMYLNYAALYGLMRGVKVRTAYAVG